MNERTAGFPFRSRQPLLSSTARKKSRAGRSARWQAERLEDRMLLAVGPQLLGINPSNGGLLVNGSRLDVAPYELTFRFDENQVIDASSLDGIQIVRAGGDGSLTDGSNVAVATGYKGIGNAPNEVVVRFAETLPDDLYRVDVIGAGASALTNVGGDPFNGGQNRSIGFELTLGAQVVSVVPQPIVRNAGILEQRSDQIVVYFNNDDLVDSSSSAENPAFYQLIATKGTISNLDDEVHLPIAVSYDAQLDRAILTFRNEIGALSGTGVYRLRIGTDEAIPAAPISKSPTSDPGSSFGSAFDLGAFDRRSVIVNAAIEAQNLPVTYPGGDDEPGHRDIPAQDHILGLPDSADGTTEIAYNFQTVYASDTSGNPLFNVITERQKERVREAFDLYGQKLGVKFYETADSGIIFASGDMRVLRRVPVGLGGTLGVSGLLLNTDGDQQPAIILDNAENWDDTYGGDWFQVSMREIGRILGIGVTEDLPPVTESGQNIGWLYGDIPLVNEVGEGIYPNGTFPDAVFPSDATIVHGQYLFRPDSIDIDLYRFTLPEAGEFTVESLAERLPNSSSLNTVLTLYREQSGTRQLVARNDNFFSQDSFIDLTLESGVYFLAVSAQGNDEFDPNTAGTGSGGTSQGAYELRFKYRPVVDNDSSIRDADATGSSTGGTQLDGDADGAPGGVYDFWFRAVANSSNVAQPRTIFVDKGFADTGGSALLGSLQRPYSNLGTAIGVARAGDIVRVLGNGGSDADLSTLSDNRAYEIGRNAFGALSDGASLNVPKDVTLMIDAGAIVKLSQAAINVGSLSVSIDRSGSALQVLGTPNQSVIFTSADDETIGIDTNPLTTTPDPGDWGGILFANDVDRGEGRFDYEKSGIFMNYVNHADLRYGGGRVRGTSVSVVIAPIHMIDARPTISFNSITLSADAAISANPDSFETTNFQAIDSLRVNYQVQNFTPDYRRVGPQIHGNRVANNTINGLFVRIDTPAGGNLENMTVTGRWDDRDIVHVVSENLIVQGTPGGGIENVITGLRNARTDAHLVIDPGIVVKLDGARIEATVGAQITAEGTADRQIVMTSLQDSRYGAGGTFATSNNSKDTAAAGDWSGIYAGPTSILHVDQTVLAYGGGLSRVEGSFAAFNAIEIHQAVARINNTRVEYSDRGIGGQSNWTRVGRGVNAPGAIYVRGAQPVIANTTVQFTQGDNSPAISIDVNSLNATLIPDTGRTRGVIDLLPNTMANQGPLLRNIRLSGNGINGMVVRGGILTAEGVWDDTDIVHVLLDKVVIPDFHTFGGLRLESSAEASLVVKAINQFTGIVAAGWPSDIVDRVGGRLVVLGQPGSPVVITSLADDSVGAGLDAQGRPQKDTDGGGRPYPEELPGSFQIDVNYGPVARTKPDFIEAVESAVQIWERTIRDPIRVTIDVEVAELGTNYSVYTSQRTSVPYATAVAGMQSDAAGRSNEQIVASLPTLDQFRLNAILPQDTQNPFSLTTNVSMTTANAKALGLGASFLSTQRSQFDPTEIIDGRIEFDENPLDFDAAEQPIFWDMERADGKLRERFDLTGVAISSIGKILGFTSAVEDVAASLTTPTLPRSISVTPLDLYRLEPGAGAAGFRTASRVLDPDRYHVLYDGGFYDPTRVFAEPGLTVGDIPLSTSELGDGEKADSWKLLLTAGGVFTGERIGAMIDTLYSSDYLDLSTTDRQAFDLIGYDVVGGPIAGDWDGLALQQYSHDRNVATTVEAEPIGTSVSTSLSTQQNDDPDTAEFLGALATREFASDDNLRLGFEVHGTLRARDDMDVYSFTGIAGTEVWFDIDRTSSSLDSVIELINLDGAVLARSDNSVMETVTSNSLQPTGTHDSRYGATGVFVAGLQKSSFQPQDFYSTNPLDAGMRVILPGAAGISSTYHVRVRSSSGNLASLTDGLTMGSYQLGIRLRELDEVPGSTIQYADIGYAVDGIQVSGLPMHSPLGGEVAEDGTPNSELAGQFNDRQCIRPTFHDVDITACTVTVSEGFSDAQFVGNVLSSDRGTVTIAGRLDPEGGLASGPGDTDWYLFAVEYDNIRANGGLNPPSAVDLVFDLDYSDRLARADVSLEIYEAGLYPNPNVTNPAINLRDVTAKALLFSSRGSNDADDQPAPLQGADLDDLSRGSSGPLDPMIGPISLFPGFYLLKVTSARSEPIELGQFTDALPINPFVRIEPVNSVRRLVEDHVDLPLDDSGIGTVDKPVYPQLIDPNVGPSQLSLGDLVLFGSRLNATSTGTELFTIDPVTGVIETRIGGFGRPVRDIALRDNPLYNRLSDDPEIARNQRLHAFTISSDPSALTDETVGNYVNISPEDGSILNAGDGGELPDDGVTTWVADPEAEPEDDPTPVRTQEAGDPPGIGGINYEAIVFNGLNVAAGGDVTTGFVIGNRADNVQANIMYRFDAVTGRALGISGDRTGEDLIPSPGTNPGTQIKEMAIFDTTKGGADNSALIVPASSVVTDGTRVVVTKTIGPITQTYNFEFDSGLVYRLLVNPQLGLHVRDGDAMTIGGTRYEFDTGPVLVLNAGALPADGETLTITDARGVATTFEFDSGNGVATGRVAVPLAGNLANSLTSIINAVGDSSLQATTVNGNRISLKSDSRLVAPISGTSTITVSGAYGATGTAVPVEENLTQGQFMAVISQLLPNQVGVSGDQFNFLAASDLSDLVTRGIVTVTGGTAGVATGSEPIPYLIGENAEQVAGRLVSGIQAYETRVNQRNLIQPSANGEVVLIGASNTTFTVAATGFRVGGKAAGGVIRGMAFVGTRLFAVDDKGGLYEIENPDTAPKLTYIRGSARYQGTGRDIVAFTGLTSVPEGHPLAGTLIASTRSGLVAFDVTGKPMPVFASGASRVSFVDPVTGAAFAGVDGITFGTVGENLWSVTNRRSDDVGHEDVNSSSFFFGDSGSENTSRNYNFAGGTQGSMITNPISLEGYTAADSPYLYFTYFLATDGRSSTDSFRVFISDNDVEEDRGVWHLLASNQNDAPVDRSRVTTVQPLFDNSFQDVPIVPDADAGPFAIPTPNGSQDVFPFVDDTVPFNPGSLEWDPFESTVLNEENIVWRQARVSLAGFAGSSSLRLRFDFSTAGSLDYGATGGVELHAIAGDRLQDGETFTVGGAIFEFDSGMSVTPGSGQLFADGDVIIVDPGTGVPVTFEIDKNNALRNASYLPFTVSDSDSSLTIAQRLGTAIAAQAIPGVSVRRNGNILNLVGVDAISSSAANGLIVSGQVGVADGHVRVPYDRTMSDNDVAEVLQEVLANRLANGSESLFVVTQNIVRFTGIAVDDQGPLGYAGSLAGDQSGSFYSRQRGVDNNQVIVGDPENEDAQFTLVREGVFLDEFIIGFTSRGEQVTDERVDYCNVVPGGCENPDADVYIENVFDEYNGRGRSAQATGISVGEYQLEIRRGTTISDGQSVIRTLDPQQRLSQSVTLIAQAGADLYDGKVFTVTDGTNTIVFEYDDVAGNNGVQAGRRAISFAVSDPAYVVATRIRDAFNLAFLTKVWTISAATSDGQTSGGANTDVRVNLFGNAVVTDNGILALLNNDIGGGNLFRDQGQVIINANNIHHSARYGISVQGTPRDMPGEPLAGGGDSSGVDFVSDTLPTYQTFRGLPYSRFTASDYNSHPGTVRNTALINNELLTPGITITNNVIGYGGDGGIRFGGDQGGYVFVAPVGGDEPTAEIWEAEDLFFGLRITDHNGLTLDFEFNVEGGSMADPTAIPILWSPAARYDDDLRDMADAMMEALEDTELDVTVYRGAYDEIYIAGVISIIGLVETELNVVNPWAVSTWSDTFAIPVQSAAVPFGRIVNNTLVGHGGVMDLDTNVYNDGDFNDIGIRVEYNASPTLLNNVIVNFERGVWVDQSSTSTVIGGQLYQGNFQDARNIGRGDFAVVASTTERLFVDFENGNFYPAPLSRIIDSSVDSLEERDSLTSVKTPLGIGESPILSPDRDRAGQRRVDDPAVEPPSGVGNNVFKDRGALDRSDVIGPSAELLTPRDNGSTDLNSALTRVRLNTTLLPRFEIRLNDGSEPGLSTGGSGIDHVTVSSSSVRVFQDNTLLVDTVDYGFSYDTTNRTIRLTPSAGVWEAGHTYEVVLVNSGSAGIQDIAGHTLQANQTEGSTKFTIEFVAPTDFGDAPAPYPTLLANDGARHNIVPSVFLGTSVSEEGDGQPSASATGDFDDGVTFSSFEASTTTTFTVTASVAGFIDGWIDFNQDGDWLDAGEQVFARTAVDAGANPLEATIPATALNGTTFARFRYSTTGGLLPTGAANDGEVEDYIVRIGPDASWQNPINRLDVNNDGDVSAIDALLVINELNRPKVSDPTTGKLPPIQLPPTVPPGFLDVNGDGFVAPIDALLVINFLNLQSAQQQTVVKAAAPVVVSASIPASSPLANASAASGAVPTSSVDAIFADHTPSAGRASNRLAVATVPAADVVRATRPDRWTSSDWQDQDDLLADLAHDVAGQRRKRTSR